MNRVATDLAGVRHLSFETLGSTNAEALARARAGEHGPFWISASSQSAGRGRRGKAWSSLPGNLHATLLLSEPSPPAIAPQLSLVAALAVRDAIAAHVPATTPLLKLKWPNDLLLDDRKVAGLLIEAETQPRFAVAVGIGINCAAHPADTTLPATDLRSYGHDVTPDELLISVSAAFTARLDQWRAGAGFPTIRHEWLQHAASLGQLITVRLPERQLAGLFRGLDGAGRLVVERDDKTIETVTAGEVFGLGQP